MSIAENIAKFANAVSAQQTAFVYRYDTYAKASVMLTEDDIMMGFKEIGKPVSIQGVRKQIAEFKLDKITFKRSMRNLKMGHKVGSSVGGIEILAGDENPKVLQQHVELLGHACRIVPFADYYMAPKFRVIVGGKPSKEHHLQVVEREKCGLYRAVPIMLIPSEQHESAAMDHMLIAAWCLIEMALKEWRPPEILNDLARQIAANESATADTRGLDDETRRAFAWLSYAKRRSEKKNVDFDTRTLTGPDAFFEEVWTGQTGQQLAKFVGLDRWHKSEVERRYPALRGRLP